MAKALLVRQMQLGRTHARAGLSPRVVSVAIASSLLPGTQEEMLSWGSGWTRCTIFLLDGKQLGFCCARKVSACLCSWYFSTSDRSEKTTKWSAHLQSCLSFGPGLTKPISWLYSPSECPKLFVTHYLDSGQEDKPEEGFHILHRFQKKGSASMWTVLRLPAPSRCNQCGYIKYHFKKIYILFIISCLSSTTRTIQVDLQWRKQIRKMDTSKH